MNNKAADNIPELVPPGTLNDSINSENNNQSLLIIILIGLVIFLLLIILFIMLKPDNSSITVSQENIHTNDSSSVSVVKNKSDQFVQKQMDKLEKLINQWLLLESEVEQKNYVQWAEKDIIQARSNALQGDQYIRESNLELAEISYQNAISKIEQLNHSKSSILKHLLLKADNALATEDWETAKQLYNKSLLIDEGNQQALRGITRSTHLPEVMELYQKASRRLNENDVENIQKYNEIILLLDKAVGIDKAYKPAVQLLTEVHKKNNRLIFQQQITQSMKSLEKNKFASARQFLSRAREIESQDPAIEELEKRINADEKDYLIRELRKTALLQEKHEQWPEVINTLDKILIIEPHTVFAINKKIQAETYNKWFKILDNIIDHPEKLQTDMIRQNSRGQVALIRKQVADNLVQSRKLNSKLSQANMLIEESFIDINVELLSDNKTQISIYKVGRLGKFNHKIVVLKPGKYTVVGSRSGYRDVRLIINIKVKDKTPIYSVICKDVI